MPHVVPMKTLSGPEFTAWYIKHKKGSGLEGAAYMALSKEDKVKAREHLKRDIEYRDKYRDIRAMWKKCYAGFSHKKKHIDGLKLARYIRDNITKRLTWISLIMWTRCLQQPITTSHQEEV